MVRFRATRLILVVVVVSMYAVFCVHIMLSHFDNKLSHFDNNQLLPCSINKEHILDNDRKNHSTLNITGEEYVDLAWSFYSDDDDSTTKKVPSLSKKVTRSNHSSPLIAQYSGVDEYYSKMTDISMIANRAYAKKWHYDYVRLDGAAYEPHQGLAAMYNKIFILRLAQKYAARYEAVLILDSDAVLVGWDMDIMAELFNSSILLVGHKFAENDPPSTFRVNNGVTFWNTRHPELQRVVDGWDLRAREQLANERKFGQRNVAFHGDQFMLHTTLQVYETHQHRQDLGIVNALDSQHFSYGEGTLVKHFVRETSGDWESWDQSKTNTRIEQLDAQVEYLCRKWKGFCDGETDRRD